MRRCIGRAGVIIPTAASTPSIPHNSSHRLSSSMRVRTWRMTRSKRVDDASAFLNVREDGAHTPGPTQQAVEWLIREREVHGFGVETINTDAGQSYSWPLPYPCHTLMHGANRYGLQCLKNLDQLPPRGALIVSAPLKIERGSGSPLRVLALVG